MHTDIAQSTAGTHLEGPVFWIGFLSLIVALLLLDLLWFHRKPRRIGPKEAFGWVCFWVALAVGFNGFIYLQLGTTRALEFSTGYLVELALSLDNVLVFLVIFRYFKVPSHYEHRVLFWGIIGAIVLRGIFIVVGAALVNRFQWLLYLFGAFLVFTAIKLVVQKDEGFDPGHNPILKLLRKAIPITHDYHGQKFFVRHAQGLAATPLLAVLVIVDFADLIFAVDSIPAIFGVTRDAFIVFTSNIFAILGLRALYMLISGIMDRFHYLRFGLGAVLFFIGAKMLVAPWVHVPVGASLAIVGGLIGGAILVSFLHPVAPSIPKGE
jgi:tellurite resistance protein TerC